MTLTFPKGLCKNRLQQLEIWPCNHNPSIFFHITGTGTLHTDMQSMCAYSHAQDIQLDFKCNQRLALLASVQASLCLSARIFHKPKISQWLCKQCCSACCWMLRNLTLSAWFWACLVCNKQNLDLGNLITTQIEVINFLYNGVHANDISSFSQLLARLCCWQSSNFKWLHATRSIDMAKFQPQNQLAWDMRALCASECQCVHTNFLSQFYAQSILFASILLISTMPCLGWIFLWTLSRVGKSSLFLALLVKAASGLLNFVFLFVRLFVSKTSVEFDFFCGQYKFTSSSDANLVK